MQGTLAIQQSLRGQVIKQSASKQSYGPRQRGRLLIRAAVTKETKEKVVSTLKEKLSDSFIVFGLSYKGLNTKDMEGLRRKLPEGCSVYVAKNSLMKRAIDEVEKDFTPLKSLCLNENMWVFLNEDGFKDGVKTYLEYESALLDAQPDAPKGQPKPPPPTEVKSVIMEGNLMDYDEFKKLQKAPGKKELYAKIAGMVKQMPTKVAVGIKAVPNKTGRAFGALGQGLPKKLASAIKQVSELNDDKSMTVEAALKAKDSS